MSKTTMVGGGAAALIALMIAAFLLGHSCSSCDDPPVLPPVGVDAGPGLAEIDERERQAELLAEQRLAEIEREHQAELDAFDEAQRHKYEIVREEGPAAVAAWLTDFNRSLLDAGTR